jgi:hypothetical protein
MKLSRGAAAVFFAAAVILTPLPLLAQQSGSSTGDPGQEAGGEPQTDQSAPSRPGPEKPAIELPPVVFEYDSIERRDIDAVLPEGKELDLPAIEVALPEPADLTTETPAAELAGTGVGKAGPAEQESPFFSDGMIGVGLNYSLLGDISLYRRGSGPDFSIGFSHEGFDGYGDRSSGSGFFHRREELRGSVELVNSETALLRTSASYGERETGLQDYPDASSLLHRFTRLELEYEGSPGEHTILAADASGHIGGRITAGDVSGGASYTDPHREYFLRGSGRWGGQWRWGELAVHPGYTFHRGPAEANTSAFSGMLEGIFYLGGTDLELSGGAEWWESVGLLYPWELRVSGIAGSSFHYTLGGGYAVHMPTYRVLWEEDPLLDTAGTGQAERLQPQHGWRAELSFGLSPAERWDLRARGTWGLWENYPLPENLSAAAANGLFPFSQESLHAVDLQLEARYSLPAGTSFSGSWEGQLLEEDPRRPGSLVSLSAGYEEPEGRYGGEIKGSWDVEGGELPEIGAELYYRLDEGVLLRLSGSDLVAPLNSSGRPWWGGYIEPGFNVTIKTEISL